MKEPTMPVTLEDGDVAKVEYDESGITEVVKIEQGRCIGCLNISKSHWPTSFYEDEGFAELTTESQWKDFEGERIHDPKFHFCPVCGRSLKELANDSDYLPPWEASSLTKNTGGA